MKNILITGSNGFIGRNLYERLILEKETKVYCVDTKKIKRKNYVNCNLSSYKSTVDIIKKIQPNEIYNMAGSFTNSYKKDFKNNFIISKNILDAVKFLKKKVRVLLVGSASEYGNVSSFDNPIKEHQKLNPYNIYGFSKSLQSNLMNLYCNLYGLDIVMGRPFNIYGNGISKSLLPGKIYEEINNFKKGKIKKIELGNLDSVRDYIHIDLVIDQLIRVMKFGHNNETYNIGTGKPQTTESFLKKILKSQELSFEIIKITKKKYKSIDPSVIYADINKINKLRNKK